MILTVTSAGIQTMAEALQGQGLNFTKCEVGSGTFDPSTMDAKARTALVSEKTSIEVTKVEPEDSGVVLEANLTGEDIPNGMTLKEVGWYAQAGSGTERLFAYGYETGGSVIPPKSETYYTRRIVAHIPMSSDESSVVVKVNALADQILDLLGLYIDDDGDMCQQD